MKANEVKERLRAKLPVTPELLAVARRVVWFKSPEEALEDPIEFLTYLMTYTSVADLLIVSEYLSHDDFRQALEHAPAGVFDAPSWSYWNLVCGRDPRAAMPRRHVPDHHTF